MKALSENKEHLILFAWKLHILDRSGNIIKAIKEKKKRDVKMNLSALSPTHVIRPLKTGQMRERQPL